MHWRSNIKELIKVAKMFNNHIRGVINALTTSFSNANGQKRIKWENTRNKPLVEGIEHSKILEMLYYSFTEV